MDTTMRHGIHRSGDNPIPARTPYILTITIDRQPAHSRRQLHKIPIPPPLHLLGLAATSGKTLDVELKAGDRPLRGAQPLAEASGARVQDLKRLGGMAWWPAPFNWSQEISRISSGRRQCALCDCPARTRRAKKHIGRLGYLTRLVGVAC